MNKSTKILLVTALLLVALAAVILYFSSTVFLQLFIAFALAYMLNPGVVFLERKGVGRIPSILIVFTAVQQVFLRSLAAWYRESDYYGGI